MQLELDNQQQVQELNEEPHRQRSPRQYHQRSSMQLPTTAQRLAQEFRAPRRTAAVRAMQRMGINSANPQLGDACNTEGKFVDDAYYHPLTHPGELHCIFVKQSVITRLGGMERSSIFVLSHPWGNKAWVMWIEYNNGMAEIQLSYDRSGGLKPQNILAGLHQNVEVGDILGMRRAKHNIDGLPTIEIALFKPNPDLDYSWAPSDSEEDSSGEASSDDELSFKEDDAHQHNGANGDLTGPKLVALETKSPQASKQPSNQEASLPETVRATSPVASKKQHSTIRSATKRPAQRSVQPSNKKQNTLRELQQQQGQVIVQPHSGPVLETVNQVVPLLETPQPAANAVTTAAVPQQQSDINVYFSMLAELSDALEQANVSSEDMARVELGFAALNASNQDFVLRSLRRIKSLGSNAVQRFAADFIQRAGV